MCFSDNSVTEGMKVQERTHARLKTKVVPMKSKKGASKYESSNAAEIKQ